MKNWLVPEQVQVQVLFLLGLEQVQELFLLGLEQVQELFLLGLEQVQGLFLLVDDFYSLVIEYLSTVHHF